MAGDTNSAQGKGFWAKVSEDSLDSDYDFEGLGFDDLARLLATMKQMELALLDALDSEDEKEG